MVVDCGGGTVDITVHQVDKGEKLIELYRASGGPFGSVGKMTSLLLTPNSEFTIH
jgi:molecular chaperone DnaK (HSP70)